MNTFQIIGLILTMIWLVVVVTWFRRSTIALIIGLVVLAGYILISVITKNVTFRTLGLGIPASWITTVGYALAGLILMLVYSPLADWLASLLFSKPPTLQAFGRIQDSWINLVIGIIIAWFLGGILEELIARGLILKALAGWLDQWISIPFSACAAILITAMGAGVMHFYQGPRAVAIIFQLSILLGILFVITGYNLWAVMICHGLYDTIAFIRFALKKSRVSQSGARG
jgi:membrane protease YdiL (CAAX protease family)